MIKKPNLSFNKNTRIRVKLFRSLSNETVQRLVCIADTNIRCKKRRRRAVHYRKRNKELATAWSSVSVIGARRSMQSVFMKQTRALLYAQVFRVLLNSRVVLAREIHARNFVGSVACFAQSGRTKLKESILHLVRDRIIKANRVGAVMDAVTR